MALAPINPSTPQGLRALKILVVVMGLAIVASIVVIVATVAGRLSGRETGRAPAAAAVAHQALADLDEISIAIPEGCVIAATETAGQRLVLRLDGLAERGCQQVILVDLEGGRVTGRITARPQP